MNTDEGGEFGLSTYNRKSVHNSGSREMAEFTASRISYGDNDMDDDYYVKNLTHDGDLRGQDRRKDKKQEKNKWGNTDMRTHDANIDKNCSHTGKPVHEVVIDNNKYDHSFISDLTTSEGASNASDCRSFETVLL